jgi:hypothetical protein
MIPCSACRRAPLPRPRGSAGGASRGPLDSWCSGTSSTPRTTNSTAHARLSVLYPGGAIASDAMPWSDAGWLDLYRRCLAPARGGDLASALGWHLHPLHAPLGAGAPGGFAAGRHRQMHADPGGDPGGEHARHARQGAAAAGADADIAMFDFETLTDRAEFTAMNRPAEGVKHLLVNGAGRDQ